MMPNTPHLISQVGNKVTPLQMSSTELAAKLFHATPTEETLKLDEVDNKTQANLTYFEVGAKVRETIQKLGGTMSEDLPKPDLGIPQLARAQKKLEGGHNED